MKPEEAVEVLRRCEWSATDNLTGHELCPVCRNRRHWTHGEIEEGGEHKSDCKLAELIGMFEVFADCQVALYREVRGRLVEVDAPDYCRLNANYDTVRFDPQSDWSRVTHWRLVPTCEMDVQLTEYIAFSSPHRLRAGDTLTLKMHRDIDLRMFNPFALHR